ncbi:MAG: cobalamin biosynthesis protein CobD [Acidimicrobiia bacterium]|nr:cobalamin biosynthesis protein CobD [Acidimicrobiia bacterium]
MRGGNARAAAIGLIADSAFAYPDRLPHPLGWFGTAMARVEERTYADTIAAGATYAAAGTAIGVASSVAIRSTAVATWLASGGRQLHDTALEIAAHLDADDLDAARVELPSLVGRDPDALDAAGIARATIESVAENTVDAIVAPAFWAAVAGAKGVLAHRAIDTLDSMVGYRNDRYGRFGTASARLDDAMAWVPARITVALVVAARPRAARDIIRTVRRDAPAHPSPNSGLVEAAFAAALGIELGGPTAYADRIDERPRLGWGRPPRPADIERAVSLSAEISTAMATALAGYGLARLRG